MSPPEGEPQRLDVVDGLRGVAILMVIFRHTFFDTLASPGYGAFFFAGDVAVFPFTLLSSTWMGVNLFFLDSGFVLYLPYALGRRAMRGLGDARALYLRRAWRLLPLYYVMLLASWAQDAALLHHMKDPWREIPAYFTFTFPFFRETWQPRINGALWSIGVEVCFSAVFPLLVVLARGLGAARLCAAAAAVALATRYLAYAHHWGAQSTHTLNTLADSLPGRIDNFVLGMAAATLFARGWGAIRPAVGAAAALLLYTASAWLWDTSLALGRPGLEAPLGGYALANLACFLLLLSALRSRGLLRRALSFGPLRAAGIGCYSLYLVHVPVLWAFGGAVKGAAVPAFWAITGALAWVTYQLVEKPGMERGRRAAALVVA